LASTANENFAQKQEIWNAENAQRKLQKTYRFFFSAVAIACSASGAITPYPF
jgi:hypothetical protein